MVESGLTSPNIEWRKTNYIWEEEYLGKYCNLGSQLKYDCIKIGNLQQFILDIMYKYLSINVQRSRPTL